MTLERVQHPVVGFGSLGVGGVWFVLMHEWETPFYINAALWGGIFAVLFWFLIRPMLFPPHGA